MNRRIGTARVTQGLALKSKNDMLREVAQTFVEQSALLYSDSNSALDNLTQTPITIQKPEQDEYEQDQHHKRWSEDLEKRKKYMDAIKYFNKIAKGELNKNNTNTHELHQSKSSPAMVHKSGVTNRLKETFPENKNELKQYKKVIKKEVIIIDNLILNINYLIIFLH